MEELTSANEKLKKELNNLRKSISEQASQSLTKDGQAFKVCGDLLISLLLSNLKRFAI